MRLANDPRWRTSNLGRVDYAMERDGYRWWRGRWQPSPAQRRILDGIAAACLGYVFMESGQPARR